MGTCGMNSKLAVHVAIGVCGVGYVSSDSVRSTIAQHTAPVRIIAKGVGIADTIRRGVVLLSEVAFNCGRDDSEGMEL